MRIFALRGIVEEEDLESLLIGLHAVVKEGRRNINGSKADIAVRQSKYWGGNIFLSGLFTLLGALGMFRGKLLYFLLLYFRKSAVP